MSVGRLSLLLWAFGSKVPESDEKSGEERRRKKSEGQMGYELITTSNTSYI